MPPIVHEVLRSPGQPLDAATRAFMEPRFGHDFSRVRVHTDARAAESARAVSALAYTVGSNVVFGTDRYSPRTEAGQQLLAHELAHVVQQRGAASLQSKLEIDVPGSPAECEAERLGRRVTSGAAVSVQHRTLAIGLQRQACADLLNAPEAQRVSGTAAHVAIQNDFRLQAGPRAFPITSIDGASFSHYDLECGDVPSPTETSSVMIGGQAGRGFPDLVLRNASNDIELAEIKPAHWTCIPEAERQVANYRTQANLQRLWRQQQGLGTFRLMSTGSFAPTSPINVGSEPVTVQWCDAGVIVYKAIRDQDPEVFLCNAISDQGRVDQFLDRVLGRAQAEVDRLINQVIDPAVTRIISTIRLRDGVRILYRYGREQLLRFLERQIGLPPGAAGPIVSQFPDEAVIDRIAQWLEQELSQQAEQQLRQILQTFKTRLLNRIRQDMQARIRQELQRALNAACAGVAAVSAATLLRRFLRDLMRFFRESFGREIEQVAMEVARELATALATALVAVIAVVVLIVLLPEILAAASIVAEGLAVGEGLAAVLGRLVPILLRLLPALP